MIGSVLEACTSATMSSDAVSEVIIQPAPTPCTSDAEVGGQRGDPQGPEGRVPERREG